MEQFAQRDIHISQITFSDDEGTYEGLYLPATKPKGLVVFIHGHNTFGAWELIFPAQRLLKEGYSVLLPSQAGFGSSRAPKDYCGPKTVLATEQLLTQLLNDEENLNDIPVQVWGISRGATIAGKLLVGAHQSRIVGGILQSGVYDHVKNYTDPKKPEDIAFNIQNETGGATVDLQTRSFIYDVSAVTAPVLIVHGEKDENVDVTQAYDLQAAMESAGRHYDLRVIANAGHNLSGPAHFREHILPFLNSNL